jgi:hypothetical protein
MYNASKSIKLFVVLARVHQWSVQSSYESGLGNIGATYKLLIFNVLSLDKEHIA